MMKTRPASMPTSKETIASPDPLLQFIFAMFAVLTALSVFMPMSPDAAFVLGILEVSLGIGAFVGSILNLLRGDPHGNMNLVLSVVLGFAGGITQLTGVWAKTMHLTFHPWVMSVILLLGGLYMLCFVPLLMKMPLYVVASHLFVITGFFCNSIADLAGIPALKYAGSTCLCLFAITALYQGVSLMYEQYGHHLPQGPAADFWKQPK